MYCLRRPSADRLDRFVSEQAGQQLTYAEVGATAGTMPAGYRHDRWRTDLGPFDAAKFAAAADALFRWEIQRGAGLTIVPDSPVTPGQSFAIVLPMPAGVYVAAGRVVLHTEEPDRRGFAYGTLPDHPEQGEEAFAVVSDGDRLVFEVTAFSRPRQLLVRLAGPLPRLLQLRVNKQYAAAMRRVAG